MLYGIYRILTFSFLSTDSVVVPTLNLFGGSGEEGEQWISCYTASLLSAESQGHCLYLQHSASNGGQALD